MTRLEPSDCDKTTQVTSEDPRQPLPIRSHQHVSTRTNPAQSVPRLLPKMLPTPVSPLSRPTPDLAAVVDAWPELPEVIKAGIMAMVKAAQ